MPRSLLAALVLSLIAASTQAQVFPGDSVRVRIVNLNPVYENGRVLPTTWAQGRVIGQDSATFSLVRGGDTVRVAMLDLQRVDRWQRLEPSFVILNTALIGWLAGIAAYYSLQPYERPDSYDGLAWSGAAIGAAVGGVTVAVAGPRLGRWQVVLRR